MTSKSVRVKISTKKHVTAHVPETNYMRDDPRLMEGYETQLNQCSQNATHNIDKKARTRSLNEDMTEVRSQNSITQQEWSFEWWKET